MSSRLRPFSPKWVDFHCHLDLYPDHAQLIARCDQDEVATLTVTTTPKAWARNAQLAAHSRYVRVALGLHPQLVSERAGELALWRELLPKARYVGEVGLDAGPRYYRSFELQKEVFGQVLRDCASSGGRILSVHSVRAAPTVLNMLEQYLPVGRGRVVLHWFTGSASDARRAVDLGCYFSINAEMLRSDRHRALVAKLPLDRLLTETDGPFTNIQDRRATPSDVPETVTKLAALRAIDTEAAAGAIRENLTRLVSEFGAIGRQSISDE
jgi:TatD DNase family protein